jgi:hypothetical protein
MTITEAIVEKTRDLPLDRQQEVLDFAEFLRAKSIPKRPLKSPEGLWADLDVHITREDIAELRREMWKNFPRDL